jgi:hypothetical protein
VAPRRLEQLERAHTLVRTNALGSSIERSTWRLGREVHDRGRRSRCKSARIAARSAMSACANA